MRIARLWLQPVVAMRRVNGEILYKRCAQNHVSSVERLKLMVLTLTSQRRVVHQNLMVDAMIGATNVRHGPKMENAEDITSLKNALFLAMILFVSARILAKKHVKIGPAGICAKFPGSMLIVQNPANGKIVLQPQYHLHHQQHQRIAHANVNLFVTIRRQQEDAQTKM